GSSDRGRAARGAPPPLLEGLPAGGGAAAGRARGGRGVARRRGDAHRSRPRARRGPPRHARPRRARAPGGGPPRSARVDRAAGDDGRLPAGAGRGGSGAMSGRRLRTLVLREVRATLRDPFTMTILVTVPLVALVLFGFVLATDVKHLALGVHDASATAASRRLIADLGASGTFALVRVTQATSADLWLGKLLPLGAVFAFDVVVMMLVAGFVLGVWPQGNALLFVAVSSGYVYFSLALGLYFSATSGTAAEAV